MEAKAFEESIPVPEADRLFPGSPYRFDPVGAGEPGSSRRAALAVLTMWVPLALLSAVQGLALRKNPAESFFCDINVHARFLVAAPLLILAESVCLPRMEAISRHFLTNGMVPGLE